MRYIKLPEFLKLPQGTWFCESPGVLCVKGSNCNENDFFYVPISAGLTCGLSRDYLSFADAYQRWGLYDNEAEFTVLEQKELDALRSFLAVPDSTVPIDAWMNSGEGEQEFKSTP